MSRVSLALVFLILLHGAALGNMTSTANIGGMFAKEKPASLVLQELKQFAAHATSQDGEWSPDVQREIWRGVFSLGIDYGSSELLAQFNSLAEMAILALGLSPCVTNRVCLIQFADHLGRMSERSTAVDKEAFERAYEADEALGFGSRPMAREAGSRGKPGPNMKKLKVKLSRSKYWNHCVLCYREQVLGMFRQQLFQRCNQFDVFDDDEFRKEFIRRAKLAPQWFNFFESQEYILAAADKIGELRVMEEKWKPILERNLDISNRRVQEISRLHGVLLRKKPELGDLEFESLCSNVVKRARLSRQETELLLHGK